MQSGQMRQQGGQMQGGGTQTGQTQGQQVHESPQQLVPQTGQAFDEDLTSELRVALHDFEEVSRTTRWCIDKMVDEGPEMADCIRVCQDLGELADLNVGMITRDSIYGLEAALLFAAVAEDGLAVIERHRMAHCQETADAVRRALDSTWQLIETFGEPQLMHQLQEQLYQSTEQRQQQSPQEMPPAVEQSQDVPPQQGRQQTGGGTQGGRQSQQPTQQAGQMQGGQMQGGQMQRGQMQGGQKQRGQMRGGGMQGGRPEGRQQY